MKKFVELSFVCIITILLLVQTSSANININSADQLFTPFILNRNSVTGFIFDQERSPIPNIHVELLNDFYVTISRTKTNGSGFYSFRGIPSGQYNIKVLPYGLNYVEQTRSVSLVSISAVRGSGGISEQVDFYLKVKRNANAGPLGAPGVVFAQEIPNDAKKLYEEGINDLRDKREKEGFEKLKKAIEIFPNYFLALDRLGSEYVVREYNRPAYVLLSKAVEVNPRSFSSTFGLGIVQYRLQQSSQAVETLQRATSLYNESVSAHLWLGIALIQIKKLTQAETALNQANKLGKGEIAEVHWQLARLYGEQKRFLEAASELELFLKYNTEARDTEKIKQTIAQLRQKAASK